MKEKLPYKDGEPFIAKLEQAQLEGNLDFVVRNLPRLKQLVSGYQDRIYELATLQGRAREIIERHEPPRVNK